MKNSNYQKISLNELLNSLQEELEFENPYIPAIEKFLLVEFMAWDVFYRGGYKPIFDSPKPNFRLTQTLCCKSNHINTLIKACSPKNKEIVLN